MPQRRAGEVSPREFIRRRPEERPERGMGAGPGAPETAEPTRDGNTTGAVGPAPAHRLGTPGSLAVLAISVALVGVVSLVGRSWTDTGPGSWYAGLDTAPWQPAGWAFGVVWTLLYVLMAIAAWRVAATGRTSRGVRAALAWYGVQLALNLAWTGVFFGRESPWGGMVVIVALIAAVAVTMREFAACSRPAALMLAPYLAWVVFAATLNGYVL
ncbi:MAG: tryptophan-rich sensory protein [Thermoleophilia bacterium]|nr:tryptophan-rich sensory protein [Thermoleophilia bacterium]